MEKRPLLKPAVDGGELSPFYIKALEYHRQKRFDQAISMYRGVLVREPENARALFNLAAIHIETENYFEASRILSRLLERVPNDPEVLLNMAIAESGLGRPASALLYLDDVQRRTVGNLPFNAYLIRAAALDQLGREEQALAVYRKAESLDPGNPQLLFNMAVAHDRREDYSNALRYYARYLRSVPAGSPDETHRISDRMGQLQAYLAVGRNVKTEARERSVSPNGS